jgi:hypothetical protein
MSSNIKPTPLWFACYLPCIYCSDPVPMVVQMVIYNSSLFELSTQLIQKTSWLMLSFECIGPLSLPASWNMILHWTSTVRWSYASIWVWRLQVRIRGHQSWCQISIHSGWQSGGYPPNPTSCAVIGNRPLLPHCDNTIDDPTDLQINMGLWPFTLLLKQGEV